MWRLQLQSMIDASETIAQHAHCWLPMVTHHSRPPLPAGFRPCESDAAELPPAPFDPSSVLGCCSHMVSGSWGEDICPAR